MIYFDNAATSGHKPQTVISAVNFALKNLSANPGRSGHQLSQHAATTVYHARQTISDFFGSSGAETVVFTLNCTQGINYVLKGVLNKGDHVVVSDLEHNAVMRPITAMGIDCTQAVVSLEDDCETLKNFKDAITSNTKMIFCTAASNVLGKILPLKEIGEICRKKGILFAVDAAQAAGVMPINVVDMNIDYLCVAAHKGLYCPMGVGILIARGPINKTIIEGGTGVDSLQLHQPKVLPEMLESGTINLPAIASISAGVNFVKNKINNIMQYENFLTQRFYHKLKNSDVVFYTNPFKNGYAPVLSFNVRGYSSDEVASYLSKKGFALRAGLHCAPSAHKKIGTLKQGTIRFSPSIFNSVYQVDLLAKTLNNFSKIAKIPIE